MEANGPIFNVKSLNVTIKCLFFRGNDQRFRLKSLNFKESRNHRETAKIPPTMFKKKRVCVFRQKGLFFSSFNGRNKCFILSEDLTHIKIILGKFEN